MIVKVHELVKKYGDVVAVDKVDLEINEGEIYGLLGPNGAGKTTFINIICDMVKRNSGELYLFDEKIDKSIQHLKKDIGVVPQTIAIYEDLTASENVAFFASLYGIKGDLLNERVKEALEFVGLSDHSKTYPKTFSGGMKRRLNIACAIAHHPRLVIMDEPTVGIDPQSRNHILNSVKKLNQLGSTIIYTSHYMEEVEQICTRIGILDHGKVIAEGTKEELQSIVTDRKTIKIKIGYDQVLDTRLLKDVKGVMCIAENANILTVECQKESDCISEVMAILLKKHIKVIDIQMESVSLESAFLSLTGRRLRD
ncbi:MAG: ABC transporter ATP-binding protein [Clostridiales bacterium]|nr:ABC transporter ATP-binding protein [Clostridiales bacterium]